MIRYTLKCSQDHVFESWFANAEGYESLKAAGHVTCAICGETNVEKTLMAPAVPVKGERPATPPVTPPPEAATAPVATGLTAPSTPQEVMLQKLKAHIEANSDYVGRDFATTARAIHEGDQPDRPIHGEASFEEAKSLVEDGVPVAPLPFTPTRKTN